MILAIDHIQLAMPPGSEENARQFYAGQLGFEEVEKPEPLRGRGGCWFRCHEAVIHLGIEEPFTPARKAHPALRVRDLEALRSKWNEEGVETINDTSLEHVRRFFAFDPFGNRIEFMQDGDTY